MVVSNVIWRELTIENLPPSTSPFYLPYIYYLSSVQSLR